MTDSAAPASTEASTAEPAETWFDELAEYVEWLANRTLRSAELILVSGAFAYAARFSHSTVVGAMALLLCVLTMMYIAMSFSPPILTAVARIKKTKNRLWYWTVMTVAGLSLIAAAVLALVGMWAGLEAILAAAER